MQTFPELAASRREWIHDVLIPWCRRAPRKDLIQAEQEWQDLAGRPAPEMTLWLWAWQRFPALCEEGLTTLNETWPVRVHLRDGRAASGYPDARQSRQGKLLLVADSGELAGPYSIDDIESVERAGA